MAAEMRPSEIGEPTWDIAQFYPVQGSWSASEYLRLDVGRLVEFDNGKLEVLPMSSELHQAIAFFLCLQIKLYSANDWGRRGECFMAPLRVRTVDDKYREPDVLFMLEEHRDRRTSRYWTGADLVVEIVSDDDAERDLVTKREEYAAARIPEYWIVDPRDCSITVLTLGPNANQYTEAGRYTGEQTASSVLLNGFEVSVRETFDRPEVKESLTRLD